MDWVVRTPDGKLLTLQVKWASTGKHGLPTVSLRHSKDRRTTGKPARYAAGEFDFIVGYDYLTDTCYVWSWSEVDDLTTSVTVNPDVEEAWGKLC